MTLKYTPDETIKVCQYWAPKFGTFAYVKSKLKLKKQKNNNKKKINYWLVRTAFELKAVLTTYYSGNPMTFTWAIT